MGSREGSLLAAGHLALAVCDWTSHGFLLPTCPVFPASGFRPILERETAGSTIYKDTVLGSVSGAARGEVLAGFTRQVIQQLHPTAVLQDPKRGVDCNGKQRGQGSEPYDFLWDQQRVEVKSALLTFNKRHCKWLYYVQGVKLVRWSAEGTLGQAFDRLLLCLATPQQLRIYEHDLLFCVSRRGRVTQTQGFDINLCGPRGIYDWECADQTMQGKLEHAGNGCCRLATFPLSEVAPAFGRWQQEAQLQRHAYVDVPLADASEKLRGQCLEAVVREIAQELFPASLVSAPPPSQCCNGRATDPGQRQCDWVQHGRRVECKSAKQHWDRHNECWRFRFSGVKLADHISGSACFDELILAFYCPQGLYVFRHDGALGLARNGVATQVKGHSIQLRAPRGVECWELALDSILQQLLSKSGCECLAFVDWFQ